MIAVVLAEARSGTLVDLAVSDPITVPASGIKDESIAGTARFPARFASAVRAGVEMQVVLDEQPDAYLRATVQSVRAAPDGGADASFRVARAQPALQAAVRGGAKSHGYVRIEPARTGTLLRGDVIRHEGAAAYVLRVSNADPPRVERRAVTTGPRLTAVQGLPNADVEITGGLTPGDRVILDAPIGIREGDFVSPVRPPHVTGNPKDECNPLRFAVSPQDDGTVLDTRLRIVWQRGHSAGATSFEEAARLCDGLHMRLPTRAEAETLFEDQVHECTFDDGIENIWAGTPGDSAEARRSRAMVNPRGQSYSAMGPGSPGRSWVRCVRDVAP
jgi:hypothetical protein